MKKGKFLVFGLISVLMVVGLVLVNCDKEGDKCSGGTITKGECYYRPSISPSIGQCVDRCINKQGGGTSGGSGTGRSERNCNC